MSQDGLVDKGIKWLLEKLENGVEEMMKMDKESKGLEITFMKCLSFLGAVNDAYSATRKVMKVGESDPEFLKYYEQIASELKKVENHMKTRLGDIKKILQFTVFDDKIKIPAEKISEALNYYYNNISASNKQGFIEKVRGHGPPVNVLIRLRDQLPRILEDFKKESSGYTRCAQMALLVIIQMVTANEEYVHARFAEEKYSKRNTQCHYELMELVREIYDILGINIDYPKIDEDKVGAIVKNIASSSNDGHHEILIHEALKKEFEGDHFLVMTYNDNWKQPEMTRDGNTYTFHQDGNFYLVHRFKVMLPNNSDKLMESRAKCDDILSDHLYEKKYYWRDVAKKITEQTKSFAIFYSKFGDAIEYRLNYKIDDEVKSALYYKDWTVEGADVNNGDQVVRATFIATLI